MVTRTREVVLDALLARLKLYGGSFFKLYTRRWVAWIDDPEASRPPNPFLVQWQAPVAEHYSRQVGSGLPPKRTLDVYLLLYDFIPSGATPGVKDATTAGGTVCNRMVDAIEAAFAPDDDQSGRLTLGGLVIDCGIDGDIVMAPGDADPSGLCSVIVPIKILVQ